MVRQYNQHRCWAMCPLNVSGRWEDTEGTANSAFSQLRVSSLLLQIHLCISHLICISSHPQFHNLNSEIYSVRVSGETFTAHFMVNIWNEPFSGKFSHNRNNLSQVKEVQIKSLIFFIIPLMLPLLSVCPSDFLALAFPSFDKWTLQSDTDVSVQWDRQFIMHTRCAHTFKFCWPLTISDHWLRFCLTERCDRKIPSGASRSDWGTARAMGVMEGDRDEKTGSKSEKKNTGR